MELGFDETEADGTDILSPIGEIDVSTAPQLREKLVAYASREGRGLILDLGSVSFIDSTGLGVLVTAFNRLREQDRRFGVVCSSPKILRVLEITGLATLFALYPSVEEALGGGATQTPPG
jgi:anti-sigma B factor antagonist